MNGIVCSGYDSSSSSSSGGAEPEQADGSASKRVCIRPAVAPARVDRALPSAQTALLPPPSDVLKLFGTHAVRTGALVRYLQCNIIYIF